MSLPSRLCAVALLAAALGGCNAIGSALGGNSGVMPESEVGPPPSMRGSIKTARERTTTAVDDDGNPVSTAPTRQLALPKTVKGETRSADSGPRRINREDLEGADTNRRSGGGGGMTPAMTGGGVGLGGKF
ncbi:MULTISPECIES: hypothetical protein [Methylobacterium]|uniref:Lipoprotein n=1 Tax=Methylobacterium thuringiense TaxID=1003091 RepID=A0ABQ4TRN6_9HYPH|nr:MULTISPECIES: hypothetical protein [Methylobacterium]TXN23731.1 hypothetical protein FV217_05940 [Methylobacterium sp. WL9]GJE57291.1 hypothetical protein EKPJFOCH_3805 [Methylobacterium thuringiense]